eukprot:TRINITY_DN5791_c0_g1_i1.p1 TRINITY_DN5791_c0_g1~~TRINITY_DN5791_c0_g1_i1.p1  ORF type:complete len:174 (-),score=63.34 TRINITY_DN5791_c0_g1_i1:33-554(-)
MFMHSIERPPYSMQLFSLEDFKLLNDFALESYYKHFKLYKYAFTQKPLLDFKTIELPSIESGPVQLPGLASSKLVRLYEEGERRAGEESEEEQVEQEEEVEEEEEEEVPVSHLDGVPDEVVEGLSATAKELIAEQIKSIQGEMEEEIKRQQKELIGRIEHLEEKVKGKGKHRT